MELDLIVISILFFKYIKTTLQIPHFYINGKESKWGKI
jgi:hypothetical protein